MADKEKGAIEMGGVQPPQADPLPTEAYQMTEKSQMVAYPSAGEPPPPYPATTAPPGYAHYAAGPAAPPAGYGYPPGTQVVVTQQPVNIVTVVDNQAPVSTTQPTVYLVWSILSCLCCFWPLGIPAIAFASMALHAATHGQPDTTRTYSKMALWFNIAADVTGVILLIIVIILEAFVDIRL